VNREILKALLEKAQDELTDELCGGNTPEVETRVRQEAKLIS